MTAEEIHTETLMLYKELNLIPAVCPLAVCEKFVECGYLLATERLIKDLKSLSSELQAKQANSK